MLDDDSSPSTFRWTELKEHPAMQEQSPIQQTIVSMTARSIARHIVTLIGGAFGVQLSLEQNSQLEGLCVGVLTLAVSVAWSVWEKRKLAKDKNNPDPPIAPLIAFVIGGAAFSFLNVPGCVAEQARVVTEDQRKAISALAVASSSDDAMIGVLLDATILSRRTILIGEIRRSMISDGLVDDPASLDKLLQDPASRNALILEVRDGRLSVEAARVWLSDFIASGQLSNATELRGSLISLFKPVQDFDKASQDLRASVSERAKAKLAILKDVDDSAVALAEFASNRENVASAALSWSSAIVQSLPPGPRRDAALQLIQELQSTSGK